jgi:transposase
MRQKSQTRQTGAAKAIKDIRRATRKQYSAEEKIRIVLDGLRGEETIAELCRREGIAQSIYYKWSKEFLEAGKHRLAGDTATLLNVLTCQSNRRWISWVSPAPRFIVGTIAISLVVWRPWKINRPGHHASGIAFLMTFVRGSLTWP